MGRDQPRRPGRQRPHGGRSFRRPPAPHGQSERLRPRCADGGPGARGGRPVGFRCRHGEEGTSLCAAGIIRPILVFAPLTPRLIPRYLAQDLRPAISDLQSLDAWIGTGNSPFHVEIDTGMSRTGFRWNDDATWQNRLRSAAGFEGISTHFHSADTDPASVEVQWGRLRQVVGSLSGRALWSMPPIAQLRFEVVLMPEISTPRHLSLRRRSGRPGS